MCMCMCMYYINYDIIFTCLVICVFCICLLLVSAFVFQMYSYVLMMIAGPCWAMYLFQFEFLYNGAHQPAISLECWPYSAPCYFLSGLPPFPVVLGKFLEPVDI